MYPAARHTGWRVRLLLLSCLLILFAAAAGSIWAAPNQAPARQTVPTRTHTATPPPTATLTPDPTATFTPSPASPTQVAPTEPPPTPGSPTAALTDRSPTPADTPSPQPTMLFPVAGNDWGAPLRRSAGLALAVLAIIGILGALTVAQRSPTAGR